MEFSRGERIGNYRVKGELGRSGAGTLLRAQHVVLPRRAIIKVIHTAFASVSSFAVQTLREACILEVIAHPGVPIVYESGLRDALLASEQQRLRRLRWTPEVRYVDPAERTSDERPEDESAVLRKPEIDAAVARIGPA